MRIKKRKRKEDGADVQGLLPAAAAEAAATALCVGSAAACC